MKRNKTLCGAMYIAVFLWLMFMMATYTGYSSDEVKIRGTIVAAQADPSGKFAPVAIQCEDGKYAVLNNAVAKKMSTIVGNQADVTGVIHEIEGTKAIFVWVFQRR